MSYKRFQVALSFPNEYRDYVSQVATLLAESLGHDTILYDAWYKAEFTRPNLDTYLQDLYQNHSLLIVPFLCADYTNKDWCQLEWRVIRDLIKRRKDDDIMPMRFDNTHIPGLFDIDGYLDLRSHEPKEVSEMIAQRLKINKLIRQNPVKKNIKTKQLFNNEVIASNNQINSNNKIHKYAFFISIYSLTIIVNYLSGIKILEEFQLTTSEKFALLIIILLTNFLVIYSIYLIFKYIRRKIGN